MGGGVYGDAVIYRCGMPDALHWTGDADADALLASDPLALLIGMLLDQQISMEKAFRGPYDLTQRLGTGLDAGHLAGMDPEELTEVFRQRPALHRFPGSMAKRTQALCQCIVDEFGGDPERIWTEAADARDLMRRLLALPGYGKAKARIFVGILGKRLGIQPDGWEEVAADWPSIADVATYDDIAEVRDAKRAMKEQGTYPS